MFHQLDPRRPTPLYEQVASRLRLAVAAGELRPGDALPSVRQLASQLRINPATVVQAYRELESEGFVDMRQGSGTFVREIESEQRARERVAHALRLVRSMLADAARLGLEPEDITSALQKELGADVI